MLIDWIGWRNLASNKSLAKLCSMLIFIHLLEWLDCSTESTEPIFDQESDDVRTVFSVFAIVS